MSQQHRIRQLLYIRDDSTIAAYLADGTTKETVARVRASTPGSGRGRPRKHSAYLSPSSGVKPDYMGIPIDTAAAEGSARLLAALRKHHPEGGPG